MILLKNQKRVLDALELCGLSEYEAKAYFTLFVVGRDMTFGKLSKISNVPQSRIYHAVEHLEAKDLVQVREDMRPKTVSQKSFATYINRTIRQIKRDMRIIKRTEDAIYKTVKTLRPVASLQKYRYSVFDPSYMKPKKIRSLVKRQQIAESLEEAGS